jgi:nickel transport protein
LEGIVLGFTASYLARVKPQMLGEWSPLDTDQSPALELATSANGDSGSAHSPRSVTLPLVLLLSLLTGLVAPGTARAHRLEAEYRLLPSGRVQVESWFDLTGDSPQGATVQVFRTDGELLIEGKLDDKGLFSFQPRGAEALRVVVSAGAGHRKELIIPKAETEAGTDRLPTPGATAGSDATPSDGPFADRTTRISVKDVVAGLGFVLGLAAFVLGVRNSRRLAQIKQSSSTRLDR